MGVGVEAVEKDDAGDEAGEDFEGAGDGEAGDGPEDDEDDEDFEVFHGVGIGVLPIAAHFAMTATLTPNTGEHLSTGHAHSRGNTF